MSATEDRRVHSIDAADAGDVGAVTSDDDVGPCPSCGAELLAGRVENPRTGHVERALMHPVPFCTYFGETDPGAIEQAIARAREEN